VDQYNNVGGIFDYSEDKYLESSDLIRLINDKCNDYLSVGITNGDNVIIAHGNNYLFFCDLLALWNLGVCVTPVDPGISEGELLNLASHSGSKAIIFRGSKSIILTDESLSGSDFLVLDSEKQYGSRYSVETAVTEYPLADSPALLLYTSGSTGEPKGVLHTYRSFSSKMFALKDNLLVDDFTVTLNLLPTHFGHGLICNCLFPLLNGCDLVILPSFSMDILHRLGKIIDDHNVTFLSSVPAVWKIAISYSSKPLGGTLKRIHCGSAPLNIDLTNKIREWSSTNNVFNTYGITETGSWIGGSCCDIKETRDGFIGQSWGAEFLITKEDNKELTSERCNVCDVDELGYVWVKTPSLMKGYYNKPNLTKEFVLNTWFFTGDKGFIDCDNNLILKGRVRNEINKSGIKIMPEDIDMQLEKNDLVIEACAFGVDDSISGQDVNVAVVLKNNASLDEVKSWLRSHISSYKFPTRWFLLEVIPKTERGKVNRSNVADICYGVDNG
jgi:oxalate---CoA ligase